MGRRERVRERKENERKRTCRDMLGFAFMALPSSSTSDLFDTKRRDVIACEYLWEGVGGEKIKINITLPRKRDAWLCEGGRRESVSV